MTPSIPRLAKRFSVAHLSMTVLPRPINQNIPGQQNVVSINPLKIVKGRWTCLPLAFRFYHMKKTIDAGNVKINGKTPSFQTKFDQAIEILPDISAAFPDTPMLVVADSWFGNDGLFKPMRKTYWAAHAHSFQIARQRHFVCATTRTTETSTWTVQKVWRQDGQCCNAG